jgi:putative ABC transport system permease protein
MRDFAIARLVLFHRLFVRPLAQAPARSALLILTIALGVGVMLAIELAGNAATGSFRSSVTIMEDDGDLEVTGLGGVPDRVVGLLAAFPDRLQISPRIEDFATIAENGELVPLVGLDLVSEWSQARQDRETNGLAPPQGSNDLLGDLVQKDSIWISSHLGYQPGSRISLMINDHTHQFTVRGILRGMKTADFIVMDLAVAQQEVGRLGKVDRVVIKTPDGRFSSEWQERLKPILPNGVVLRPITEHIQENGKILAAFVFNLRMLSYVALVVGAFLIYNAIAISVARRRGEIGIARALGASRWTVVLGFLGQAATLGLVGSSLGLLVGRLLADGAVRLMAATVHSFYVNNQSADIELKPGAVLFAFAAGIAVALISAVVPAREASFVPPADAMALARREYVTSIRKGRLLLLALVVAAGAAISARGPMIASRPLFGYLSAALLIGVLALATPALVSAVLNVSTRLLKYVFGAEALLACRTLAGSLHRTSILVGALATAIALMTSVGILIGSFRETVRFWINSQLPSDLYLRPAVPFGPDYHPTFSADTVERIAHLPVVSGIGRLRSYETSYQGLPATVMGLDLNVLRLYRSSDFFSGRAQEDVLHELAQPDVAIVGEPFANQRNLRIGDTILLPLGENQAAFRIADIYYDYACERGCVVLSWNTLLHYLPDPAASRLCVDIAPNVSLDAARAQIQKAAGRNVLIFSSREIRTDALDLFDRTFAITYAMEAVAIIVAIAGVAGALLALVIDRRREFGLLRFLGATHPQILRVVLFEAGLLGILANLAGLFLGFFLSLVLIYDINKQSFGWTIQFHSPIVLLLISISGVYLVTILAALYPARIAGKLAPVEVLHDE